MESYAIGINEEAAPGHLRENEVAFDERHDETTRSVDVENLTESFEQFVFGAGVEQEII